MTGMTHPDDKTVETPPATETHDTSASKEEAKVPLESSELTPISLSLEERRPLFDRENAAANNRLWSRALDLKQAEINKPVLRDPVFVGVLAAALSVLGSVAVTALSNHYAQDLARQKTNADIVTELIRNVDPATAKRNLQQAIDIGLVKDPDRKITDSLNKGVLLSLLPVLQAQAAVPIAGTVPNAVSHTTASVQTSEHLIADQTIVISHGGYALTPNPTCPKPKWRTPSELLQRYRTALWRNPTLTFCHSPSLETRRCLFSNPAAAAEILRPAES